MASTAAATMFVFVLTLLGGTFTAPAKRSADVMEVVLNQASEEEAQDYDEYRKKP